jgi:hypothetical protein
MILPSLYIAATPARGRGVFAGEALLKGTLIEVSPVIVMSKEERLLLDRTLLHDFFGERSDSNAAWRWVIYPCITTATGPTAIMKWNSKSKSSGSLLCGTWRKGRSCASTTMASVTISGGSGLINYLFLNRRFRLYL